MTTHAHAAHEIHPDPRPRPPTRLSSRHRALLAQLHHGGWSLDEFYGPHVIVLSNARGRAQRIIQPLTVIALRDHLYITKINHAILWDRWILTDKARALFEQGVNHADLSD